MVEIKSKKKARGFKYDPRARRDCQMFYCLLVAQRPEGPRKEGGLESETAIQVTQTPYRSMSSMISIIVYNVFIVNSLKLANHNL